MSETERYERAKERAQELKGFYIHLGIYVIVNAALFTINMLASPGVLWFYWPLIGWGVGLAIHGFVIATEGRFLGAEWEDRKARELMRKDEARRRAA